MSPATLARVLVRLLMLVVLVISGTYLVVYLYRWEWNRALISGLFFLAAEVAFIGASLRAEIRALATRTEALEARVERRAAPRPGGAASRPARPFAWLREAASGHTSVFVPVLLGAGVILSAVAYVVERLAELVTRATLARAPGHLLAVPQPPAHGLLGPRGRPVPPAPPRPRPAARAALSLVALAVLGVVAVLAIDALADATQSRPTRLEPGTATVIDLHIDQRRARPAIQTGEALAVACRSTLRSGAAFTSVTALGPDEVRLEVAPALSELRRRRLFGCLEDATLDLVQADVTAWHTTGTATTGAGDGNAMLAVPLPLAPSWTMSSSPSARATGAR